MSRASGPGWKAEPADSAETKIGSLDRYRRDFETGLGGSIENLLLLMTVDSTNRLARDMVRASLDRTGRVRPVVVAALEQTAGRGRMGRSWESPRGKGVYASLVVPVCPLEALGRLPLLVGVGLCRGLSRYTPKPCRLKWPNDLMVGGRKIGGILIESVSRSDRPATAIIGFGVNHGHGARDLPAGGGTSLELLGGGPVSLGELAGGLVSSVERELSRLSDSEYAIRSYREHTLHAVGEVMRCRTAAGDLLGRFAGFDHEGRLRLETATGIELVNAGEVWSSPPGGEVGG